MKTKYPFLFLLFVFSIGGPLWSQQNTSATGGEATGSGGTVSYTVGQIDFSSQTGTNGSVSQGVQQPLLVETNSLFEKNKDFNVLLFPNPTVAELHVDLKDVSINKLNYVLTDANGKEIQTLKITSNKITINLQDFTRGNYFLNFTQDGKVLGSYTVIKN